MSTAPGRAFQEIAPSQQVVDGPFQVLETGVHAVFSHDEYQVPASLDGRKPEDLLESAPEPVSNNGIADSASCDKSKAGFCFVIGEGPQYKKIVDPNPAFSANLGKPSAAS